METPKTVERAQHLFIQELVSPSGSHVLHFKNPLCFTVAKYGAQYFEATEAKTTFGLSTQSASLDGLVKSIERTAHIVWEKYVLCKPESLTTPLQRALRDTLLQGVQRYQRVESPRVVCP